MNITPRELFVGLFVFFHENQVESFGKIKKDQSHTHEKNTGKSSMKQTEKTEKYTNNLEDSALEFTLCERNPNWNS